MRKYLFSLVAVLLLITGCGNERKKLTCTMEEDGTINEVKMEFGKNDNLTLITMKMVKSFEKELTDDEVKLYENASSVACEQYPKESVECEANVTKKELELVVTYKIAKMTNEELSEAGYKKESATYDEMKKSAENSGFTCK